MDPERLIEGYQIGVFPWNHPEDEFVHWHCPDPRGVIEPSAFHVSRSLRKHIRQTKLKVSCDQAFDLVLEGCAERREGTWISDEIVENYTRLFHQGWAHSVEVWHNDALVGGLYGVGIGKVFAAESMFHRETNASKVALWFLCQWLEYNDFWLIDTQFCTPHLDSLGGIEIPKATYLEILEANRRSNSIEPNRWRTQDHSTISLDLYSP